MIVDLPGRRGMAAGTGGPWISGRCRYTAKRVVTVVSGRQALTARAGVARRTLTIGADLHSVHPAAMFRIQDFGAAVHRHID